MSYTDSAMIWWLWFFQTVDPILRANQAVRSDPNQSPPARAPAQAGALHYKDLRVDPALLPAQEHEATRVGMTEHTPQPLSTIMRLV